MIAALALLALLLNCLALILAIAAGLRIADDTEPRGLLELVPTLFVAGLSLWLWILAVAL